MAASTEGALFSTFSYRNDASIFCLCERGTAGGKAKNGLAVAVCVVSPRVGKAEAVALGLVECVAIARQEPVKACRETPLVRDGVTQNTLARKTVKLPSQGVRIVGRIVQFVVWRGWAGRWRVF